MSSAVILIRRIPDSAPLIETLEDLPHVSPLDHPIKKVVSPANLQPFPNRVLIRTVHDVNDACIAQRLAGDIDGRIVTTH